MTEIILSASTGSEPIAAMLRGVVGIFEPMFADRIRSYYVEGSYADGTEVPTSDLDLTIVSKDRFRDNAERDTAAQLAGHCAGLSGVELDIVLRDDGQLAEGVYPSLKMASHWRRHGNQSAPGGGRLGVGSCRRHGPVLRTNTTGSVRESGSRRRGSARIARAVAYGRNHQPARDRPTGFCSARRRPQRAMSTHH
jgi:predicted nucleotidyltransferase